MPRHSDPPWFASGLQFSCTQCGDCCTGEPGYVWVNDKEIEQLSDAVGVTEAEFRARYLKREGRRLSLREKENGDCVLFERGVGCTVYSVRPRQCRSWPFWESNLESPKAWQETCRVCPGAGTGTFFSVEQIVAEMKRIRV